MPYPPYRSAENNDAYSYEDQIKRIMNPYIPNAGSAPFQQTGNPLPSTVNMLPFNKNVPNISNGLVGAGGIVSKGLGLLGAASPIGAALSFAPAAFKFFSGLSQINQAKKINPINPGFQMNNAVIDNARVLGNRYNNYQMPGYNLAKNNLETGYATAFNQGVQGASSGGDVLDLASKLSYNQGQNQNQLAMQNAQGKDQALMQSLDANANAGNELVKKNMYELQEYQRKLQEKAALMQAGAQKAFSGGDDIAYGLGSLLQPRAAIDQGQGTGTQIKNPGSIFRR